MSHNKLTVSEINNSLYSKIFQKKRRCVLDAFQFRIFYLPAAYIKILRLKYNLTVTLPAVLIGVKFSHTKTMVSKTCDAHMLHDYLVTWKGLSSQRVKLN
jgi:hypothetical protein